MASPIEHILKPVHRFIHKEYTSGIVLFGAVLVAIIWANSPFGASYHHIWETHIAVSFATSAFDQPLHVWINDGLMALFFFVIGLELKREFMVGELSTFRKASLPMFAAIGGMIVPAAIYASLNLSSGALSGWGIPMATDIAFALALLSVAGKNMPPSVKVFLSALAVADDLGAVLVIAFFYTATIAWIPLMIGLAFLGLLIGANAIGIRSSWIYLLLGIVVWMGFLFSGIHATIAGVLVAFTIPARAKINELNFSEQLSLLGTKFKQEIPLEGSLLTPGQHQTIAQIESLCRAAETPLQKIEHTLHPWVAFVIMPIFALANSGMIIGPDFFDSLLNTVSLGIVAGLVLGKFIGVQLFTWLAVKLRVASLPEGVNWKHIRGVSMLAGVGFTMSLFISGLAFSDPVRITQAKYGILIASLISAIVGTILIRNSGKHKQA
jgi:NhaA family Na+:H+ antiporter